MDNNSKKRIAICTGSFDPITNGHFDIIKRGSKLFDKVIVLISINPNKNFAFTVEEREKLIKKAVKSLPNVEVDSYYGLTVDYFEKKKATALIRGLRVVTDFEYEFQMALVNKKLNKNVETVYLNTSADHLYLSSSVVKEIAMFGGDISAFIPKEILPEVVAKLKSEGNL